MKVIIKINIFDKEQTVFITHNNQNIKTEKVRLLNIPKFLTSLDNKVEELHLYGEEIFLQNLVQQIREAEHTKYSQNTMKIFINK